MDCHGVDSAGIVRSRLTLFIVTCAQFPPACLRDQRQTDGSLRSQRPPGRIAPERHGLFRLGFRICAVVTSETTDCCSGVAFATFTGCAIARCPDVASRSENCTGRETDCGALAGRPRFAASMEKESLHSSFLASDSAQHAYRPQAFARAIPSYSGLEECAGERAFVRAQTQRLCLSIAAVLRVASRRASRSPQSRSVGNP